MLRQFRDVIVLVFVFSFPDPSFSDVYELWTFFFSSLISSYISGPFHSGLFFFLWALSIYILLFIIIPPNGVCIMPLMRVIREQFVPSSQPSIKILCEIELSRSFLGPLGDFLTAMSSAIIMSYFFPFFQFAKSVHSKAYQPTKNVRRRVSDVFNEREEIQMGSLFRHYRDFVLKDLLKQTKTAWQLARSAEPLRLGLASSCSC